MKTEERELARSLRAEGRSVKEIARLVGVSRGSVSIWVRDVVLTDEQRQRLEVRSRNGYLTLAARNREAARRRRQEAQQEGRTRARAADAAYSAGCMLFWAEGSRRRNGVALTNSDPQMMRMFVEFLRRYFDVRDEKIRLDCNLFADHVERQREIEDFWLACIDVPRSSLRKTTVNRYSRWSKRKRQNKLPYGTARITVRDTRIVQMLYGSIQELAGFERPEWLDL